MNGRSAVWTVVAALAAGGLAGCGKETPREGPPTEVKTKNPAVVIETSMGEIRIELYPKQSPITVANFLRYVDEGFYGGTIFHRVISSFMIQGGGFTPDLRQKATREPIRNEAGNGLRNVRGAAAMARTNVVDSATSQFFINVVDNGFLDHRGRTPDAFGYAVFGQVVEGMDVVDRIRGVAVGSAKGMGDVPVTPVVIESIRRVAPA